MIPSQLACVWKLVRSRDWPGSGGRLIFGGSDFQVYDVDFAVEKPEAKRNWKAVFERGQSILDITSKAIDLGHKLAPYTPAVAALVANAKHLL